MRFTTQTQTGYPWGNCVRASWATLLGVPLAVVPDFDPGTLQDKDQMEAERAWARSLGCDLVTVPVSAVKSGQAQIPGDVSHFISGLSPRGFGHRAVGRGGKLVWDPHPSRAGFVEVWSYTFLVPLDEDGNSTGTLLRGLDGELDGKDEVVDPPEAELLGFCGCY